MIFAMSVPSGNAMALALGFALVGCFIGRFLHYCVLEFPEHVKLKDQLRFAFAGKAVCRRCGQRLPVVARLPVIGAWLAGRRCSGCKSLLSKASIGIELFTGLLFAVVYVVELPDGFATTGMSTGLRSSDGPFGPEVITTYWTDCVWLHARYLLHMVMICGLLVSTVIDFKFRIIPDGCTDPLVVVAVISSAAMGQLFLVPVWFQDPSVVRILGAMVPEFLQPVFVYWDAGNFVQNFPKFHGLLVSVVGCLVGGGSVWIVRIIGQWVLKKEAMGMGDVYLMAMIGSVVGWQPVLAIFMLAPLLAIAVAILNYVVHSDKYVPYGPFLSAATVLLLLAWPTLWPYAKRFFDMGPLFLLLMLSMVFILGTSLQLVELSKRIIGIKDQPDFPDDGGWSSADHLAYYHRKLPDSQISKWPKKSEWPGVNSGKGTLRLYCWKRKR